MILKSKTFLVKTLFLLLLIAIISSACVAERSGFSRNKVYGIDKTFREYYRQLGGSEILGPVISEVFAWEENQCQYVENALMCFNPNLSQNNGYYLFPVGALFGIVDPLISNNTDSFQVFEEFLALYESIGAEATTGKQLTPVRYNLQEKRVEQYFENVGFYRKVDGENIYIELLAYGSYACNDKCQFSARDGAVVNVNANSVAMPFLSFISRYDHLEVFGEPLTAPIEIQPGLNQQIYENVVFIGNPELPETIHLLDVPIRLGVRQDQPGPQRYNLDDNMVFYVVNGLNGFHVPAVFDQFIIQHGGRELSGNPLSEVYEVEDRIRQCFLNYCLDYIHSEKVVEMVPLGQQFIETMEHVSEDDVVFEYTAETVTIVIQEKSPFVSLNEDQEIQIQILRSDNKAPLENISGTMTVTLPNGNEINYPIVATDTHGASWITIPANKRVQNGSVLTYTICMNLPGEELLCKKGSYLIW